MPGVVGHATDIIEHPELVAQRLVRYAKLVGEENVIAGTDCGLAGRVGHPEIVLGKACGAVGRSPAGLPRPGRPVRSSPATSFQMKTRGTLRLVQRSHATGRGSLLRPAGRAERGIRHSGNLMLFIPKLTGKPLLSRQNRASWT